MLCRARKSEARIWGRTYRNDGTECASCCGAYRSWTFPSLHPSVNQTHPQNIRIKRFFGTPRKVELSKKGDSTGVASGRAGSNVLILPVLDG